MTDTGSSPLSGQVPYRFRILFFLSLSGFFSALVVHVSAIMETGAARTRWVWLLHIGIFAVILPMMYRLTRDKASGEHPVTSLTQDMPWPSLVIIGLFGVYAGINFLIFMAKSHGGVPDIWGGIYVLHDHGRLIREITAEQYDHYRLNEVRGFSGHWLLFYFWPTAFYYFRTGIRATRKVL